MKKLSSSEKQSRAEYRSLIQKAQKDAYIEKSYREQTPIRSLTISITWIRSRTWGSNPGAECKVITTEGHHLNSPIFRASGCGYDKESTVIAEAFNYYLRYRLHLPLNLSSFRNNEKPYGLARYYYEGGIGTNCYYDISTAIGGSFEKIASGKTFDVFRFTSN
jgi:hypothetical protein